MKNFKFVYKLILALIALATIVFAVLYFVAGKNSIFLTLSVVFALIISVLQIAEIVFNNITNKKNKAENEDNSNDA